ncbi:MAG: hypothetical protein R3C03_13245 [Pirellulaceae bacterium]
MTFGANATQARVNTLMQNIVYWNTSDAPPASVQIDWTFDDGGDSVTTQGSPGVLQANGSTTVNITATNDAPDVTLPASFPTYTENGPAVAVDANLTVTDADSPNLTGATFRITTGYQNGFDELVFTNQLGISGTWSAATGTLTLSGTASVADYQTAMRTVAFQTAGDAPNTTCYVEIIANDGQDLSTVDTKIVQVTAVNDLPTTNDVTASGLEDDPSVAITLTGSDIDGTVNNFRIDSLPSNGTLYLNAGLTVAVSQGFNYAATGEQLTLYFVRILTECQTTFQYSARDNQNAVDPTPGTATINIGRRQ